MTRFFLKALAVLCLSIASPGLAQFAGGGSISPPAENWTVTEGGVDLRTGAYVYSQTDLSLGTEGSSLSLTRTTSAGVLGHHDPFGSFAHEWEIFYTAYQHYSGDMSDPDITNRISVWVGGRAETFEWSSSSQAYNNISTGSGAQLDTSGPNAIFTESDGTKITFGGGTCSASNASVCSYASTIDRPDGTQIQLTYDTGPSNYPNASRLRRVQSNRGFAILLEYGVTSAHNVITKACSYNLAYVAAPATNVCDSSAAQTTSYTYTFVSGRVRMSSATDATGAVWQFDHTEANGVITQKFKRPGETAYWLTNTIEDEQTPEFKENGKVTQQDFVDGTSYTYGYVLVPIQYHGSNQAEPQPIVGGSYQDANGTNFSAMHSYPEVPLQWLGSPGGTTPYNQVFDNGPGALQYQVTPGPTDITAPNGGLITNDYCDRVAKQAYPSECYVGPIQRETMQEGNFREFWWIQNPRRLVKVEHHPKPSQGGPVLTETAEYGCTAAPCKAKPTRYTDAEGNQTDYEYDTVHGGILKKTLPADANGVRAETRYTYVQRNARDASGTALQPPVYLLASEEFCRSTAASGTGCAGGATDEVVTTYDYGPTSGPNNLLLRSTSVTADGQTLTTCYSYDTLGRKISETQPEGAVGGCP